MSQLIMILTVILTSVPILELNAGELRDALQRQEHFSVFHTHKNECPYPHTEISPIEVGWSFKIENAFDKLKKKGEKLGGKGIKHWKCKKGWIWYSCQGIVIK